MTERNTVVYLRAGHSGCDPITGEYYTMTSGGGKFFKHTNGKQYHKDGFFFEGVSNRIVCEELCCQLTALGFTVVMVHDTYLDKPLSELCAIANSDYKLRKKKSIFLDMHSNAGKARGFTAFYFPGTVQRGTVLNNASAAGKLLAECIAETTNPYWLSHGSDYKYAVRKGWIMKNGTIVAPYFMLQHTNMPSIIIENGFFDNEHDADLLMDMNFVKGLCTAMAAGVLTYENKINTWTH